jgi:hypothetical protein
MRLWSGQATVELPNGTEVGPAELLWEWLPDPAIRAYTTAPADFSRDRPAHEPLALRLEGVELADRVPVAVRTIYGNEISRIMDLPAVTMGDPLQPVTSVRFAMVNMPEFLGHTVKSGRGVWAGRLELNADPWHVRLDYPEDTPKPSRLGPTGGYALSHVGLLTRLGGESFNLTDADRALAGLWAWASLMRGSYTGPIWWEGLDATDKTVWTHHPTWHLDPWNGQSGVFPSGAVDFEKPEVMSALGVALAACISMLADADWENVLLRAIAWYIQANRSNSDADIVLAQAGLELLAYAKTVMEGTLRPEGFERLRAADQLQMLLATCRISLEVPATLGQLRRYADGRPGSNAATVVTEFRNAVIHPPTRKRAPEGPGDASARLEARELSISLLERVLLAVLGYDALFRDRLHGWFLAH